MANTEHSDSRITLRDVYAARRTIAPWVRRRPLKFSRALLNLTGATARLKLETVHDTGAFKIRGATNRILNLNDKEHALGVVTISTGNHGRAVAYAAKHLAPASVGTVGIVGAGVQARYQLQCLHLVRDFERVLVRGRSRENVAAYIADMTEELGVEVVEADSMEQLVGESQVIVTTTQSREPIVRADWLHAGLHITAMGSDLAAKQELDVATLGKADRVVCDRKSQCLFMEELQYGLTAGLLSEDSAIDELGAIRSGKANGRGTADDITVCDLTGTGVEDTAIATLALGRARKLVLGAVVDG